MAHFDRSHTSSYCHSIVTMVLSFIRQSKILVQNQDFFISHLHVRCFPSEYCHMVWLPDGEKSL